MSGQGLLRHDIHVHAQVDRQPDVTANGIGSIGCGYAIGFSDALGGALNLPLKAVVLNATVPSATASINPALNRDPEIEPLARQRQGATADLASDLGLQAYAGRRLCRLQQQNQSCQ